MFLQSALLPGLDARLRRRRAVPEAIRLITGFDDVAVMREPVEHRGGHFGVVEDAGPFPEGQIGRDHHAGVLVEFGQQVKQQGATRGAEGQVSQFVENDQIHAQ